MVPVGVDATETAEEDAPRQHYRVTFGVLAIGTLAYVLMQSMVLPALALIQHDLHTSESAGGLLLSALPVSSAGGTPLLRPPGGMFGEGKRRGRPFSVP